MLVVLRDTIYKYFICCVKELSVGVRLITALCWKMDCKHFMTWIIDGLVCPQARPKYLRCIAIACFFLAAKTCEEDEVNTNNTVHRIYSLCKVNRSFIHMLECTDGRTAHCFRTVQVTVCVCVFFSVCPLWRSWLPPAAVAVLHQRSWGWRGSSWTNWTGICTRPQHWTSCTSYVYHTLTWSDISFILIVAVKLLITGNVWLISDSWWQQDVTACPLTIFGCIFLVHLLGFLSMWCFNR